LAVNSAAFDLKAIKLISSHPVHDDTFLKIAEK